MISLIDYKVEENLIRWNATELDSELFIESVRKEENSSNYTYQLVDENAPCNETRDLCKEYEAFEAAVVIILCGLIVITVIGNTLIISAVLTTKRLRTVTNCFVTSLAVADLLVGTFVMPPAIAVHVRGEWELGWILCDIWISLDILLCTASILSLCAISIDRYLAVTRPLTYSRRRRSKKLALTMILFVWIAAGAITCPPMLGWYEPDHNQGGVCRYNQNAGYVVFSAMGSFFLPMIVMVYVYARISCVVARRHQQLASTASKCTKKGNLSCIRTESDSGSDKHSLRKSTSKQTSISQSYPQEQKCPCCFRTERRQKYKKEKERESKFIEFKANYKYKSSRITRRTHSLRDHENNRVSSLRRETKTAQTLSVVVGGFIACWLPFFLYYLMTPFIPSSYVYPMLMCVLTWLGWFNSAINPFIYAFYAPDFRLAFWRLTIKKCKRSKH